MFSEMGAVHLVSHSQTQFFPFSWEKGKNWVWLRETTVHLHGRGCVPTSTIVDYINKFVNNSKFQENINDYSYFTVSVQCLSHLTHSIVENPLFGHFS